MSFSKKQAAQMVGVSMRTLDRHIAAGKIAVERVEAKTFEQAVNISLESLGAYLGISDEAKLRKRLGLPCADELSAQPSSANFAEHPAPSQPNYECPQPHVSNIDAKLQADEEFARAFLAGEVTDSFGNSLDGGSGVTALGPRPDLIIGFSPDSRRDPRYQPIRFHAPAKRTVYRSTGYGVTQEELDAEREALAAQRFSR